jgi:hypothetical protein
MHSETDVDAHTTAIREMCHDLARSYSERCGLG